MQLDQSVPASETRIGYLVVAYVATGLGVLGVFLPLLPTTPFLLVAVWAGSKGSQRVHDWIYPQPRFARLLNDWHEQGAVPLGAKLLACSMMLASWSFLIYFEYHWGVVLFSTLLFIGLSIFLWTRPNPKH